MEEKEFLREKEKLKQTVNQLNYEEKELEEHLGKDSSAYDEQAYVRAHFES